MDLVAYTSFLQPLRLLLLSSLHKRGFLFPLLHLANTKTFSRKTKDQGLVVTPANIFDNGRWEVSN